MKTNINNSKRHKQHPSQIHTVLVSHRKMTIYMHIYILKTFTCREASSKGTCRKDDNENTKERGKCYRRIYTENILLEDLTTSAQ